jgi:hypothetical protein
MGSGFSSFRTSTAPRRRRRHWLLKAVLLLVIIAVLGNVAVTPWVFHIGGRFTPLTQWNGYGVVHDSAGGHDVLYAHLLGGLVVDGHGTPGCSQFKGCDSVRGDAEVCTSKATYTFPLTGEVHTWLSTDGARTSLDILGATSHRSFDIVFTGAWHGRVLRVVNSAEFAQVFSGPGIRPDSSAAAEATADLRYGSAGGFTAACRALAR